MAQQHRAPCALHEPGLRGSTGADKGREKLRRSSMEAFESPPMHGASVASMDLPGPPMLFANLAMRLPFPIFATCGLVGADPTANSVMWKLVAVCIRGSIKLGCIRGWGWALCVAFLGTHLTHLHTLYARH